MKLRVAVLGGGACGMSAALELTKLGAQPIVFEREPRVGGLCGTHERDGFRFDFGGHRFITADASIDRLVRDLVGDDLLERRRSSVILNGGKRYKYPLELDDVLEKFGVLRGSKAMASYLGAALRHRVQKTPDETFADWVTHRFGADLYRTFFGPYTAKLWGLPPEQISADWAAQRISLPSLFDVALRLAGRDRPYARTYARRYRYPRHGMGEIFERCGAAIERLGGQVLTGVEVVGLDARGGRVRAVRWSDRGRQHEQAFDAVISTLSLPALAAMLGPMPTAVARSADRLRFRAIRLLNVLLEGPPISGHTWMYVSEPSYLMSRIQEPIHRSPSMAPPGCTSLMLEIPCAVGDATWTRGEAELYDRAVRDLWRLGFQDIGPRTIGYFSSYVREGYPIYHLAYEQDRRAVLAHVEVVRGLSSVGRQGAFRYVFMDTAMEMGIEAARGAVSGLGARKAADLGREGGLAEARALTA